MNSRKKKIVLAIVTVFFGILLGCLFGEIFSRAFAPSWLKEQMKELNLARNAQQFGSDVGWSVETVDGKFVRFVPGTHFDVHYYEYNHSVQIDQWGGRLTSADQTKTNNQALIPFLGDSFAFGIGVADNETFINLSDLHSRYRFINLGVPGSALPNQLDQLEFRHRELHSPEAYIFVFYAGNDYSDMFRYFSKIPGPEEAKPPALVRWLDEHMFRNRMLGKSYLLQLIKHTLFKRFFYADRRTESLPPSCAIRVNGKQMTSSALCIMAGNKKCIEDLKGVAKLAVNRLDDLSRKLKFVPFVLLIPDKSQVNPAMLATKAARWGLDSSELDAGLPNSIMARELMRHGIRFVDLSDCLRDHPEFYYKVDDHFTPAGHRAVAEYLSGRLDALIADGLRTAH